MTLLDSHKAAVRSPEAQALIEEARRRQRRRRRWVVTVAALLVLAVSLVVVFGSSGPPRSPTATPAPAPAQPLVAHWTNLSTTGEGLPPGAQLTSVVAWHGHLVASGSYFPGSSQVPVGYPPYAPAVVWTSTNGGQWTMTWHETAGGSDFSPELVATPRSLLLFAAGEGGSFEWHSVDDVNFVPVSLPTTMNALQIGDALWAHGRVVALVNNKYVGSNHLYGQQGDSIWTSVDGIAWARAPLPGQPVFGSLTATANGFLLTGQQVLRGRTRTWRSLDGTGWKLLPTPPPSQYINANANVIVAQDPQTVPSRFWWSRDGRSWTRGAVKGYLFQDLVSPTGTFLAAIPGVFITVGNPTTVLWCSSNGAVWTKVVDAPGSVHAGLDVAAYYPDPDGLLAEVVVPGPLTQPRGMDFWQVTFSDL